MSLSKVCVIIGAGASYDVAGEGAPIFDIDWRPPLAVDLFNISKHAKYWEVMSKYSGAVLLGQELASLIPSGEVSIEKALRERAEHEDNQIRQWFKQVPPYLRDIIYLASMRYTPQPSSYIRLIIKLLADYQQDVLFITLNYDNLLERALTLFNPKFQFNEIAKYIADDRNAKVVKLHGSTNWFRRLPGGKSAAWDTTVADLNVLEPFPEESILIKDKVQIVRDEVFEDYRLYPILTAPLAGKGLTDAVCPKNHIIAVRQFISECAKFLVIGTSGLDEDLLELLDMAIGPMRGVRIEIVDYDGGAGNAQSRFEKGVEAFGKMHGTELMTIYNEGFRKYLGSQQFQDFVTFRT